MSNIEERLKKHFEKWTERRFFETEYLSYEAFVIVCPICGEPFKSNGVVTKCCPKCKNAIMKMRSMMTEEELNG